MNIFVIVLRLVHIISGVFWVGAGLVMFFFIGPTLGATADAGQKFAQHLMLRTRFTAILTTSAILTVLAGYASSTGAIQTASVPHGYIQARAWALVWGLYSL